MQVRRDTSQRGCPHHLLSPELPGCLQGYHLGPLHRSMSSPPAPPNSAPPLVSPRSPWPWCVLLPMAPSVSASSRPPAPSPRPCEARPAGGKAPDLTTCPVGTRPGLSALGSAEGGWGRLSPRPRKPSQETPRTSGREHDGQLSKVTSRGGQAGGTDTRAASRPRVRLRPGAPHSLELLLGLASEVPHQPLRGEGVLRGHPPAHHGVEEGLALPGVESQHLRGGASRQRAVSVWGSHCSVLPLGDPLPAPGLILSLRSRRGLSSHLDVAPDSSQQGRERLVLLVPELPLGLSTPWVRGRGDLVRGDPTSSSSAPHAHKMQSPGKAWGTWHFEPRQPSRPGSCQSHGNWAVDTRCEPDDPWACKAFPIFL